MGEEWLRHLGEAASLLGVPLDNGQIRLLARYYQEIATWNEKFNLLSRASAPVTVLKNFIDSLAVLQFLPRGDCHVLDMGSGAGFPGIPLKIASETLKVSLLEASRKKASFLKHVVRTLQLKECTVLHDRAEHLLNDEKHRGAYEVVLSQAAFKLPQFLTLGCLFLARGGVVIALKGVQVDAEMAAAEPVAEAAGLFLTATHDLTLPVTGERRLIIVYGKK